MANQARGSNQPNLVVNGSFESGFGGWLGTYGYLQFPDAADGSKVGVVIDVGSSSVNQPMYQVLPTVPGNTYRISFALRGAGTAVGQQPPGTPAAITVTWGDTGLFSTNPSLGVFQNVSALVWKYFTVDALATTDSMQLSFIDWHDMNWPLIDDVRVTPLTPQPNLPPICQAGGPYTNELQAIVTPVQLDGSKSTDPEGDSLLYLWTIDSVWASFDDPTNPTPILNVLSSDETPFHGVVTLTVTDSKGASSTCMSAVTIVDRAPPKIQCPGNLTVATDPGACSAVVEFTVTATDNDPEVMIQCSPPSGSTMPKGDTVVSCAAVDRSVNKSECAFTVTVEDREAPAVTCPSDLVVPTAQGECAAVVTFSAIGSDNCPEWSVVCTPPSGALLPMGNTPVVCDATDAAGNKTKCTFTVIVQDPGPPEIQQISADPSILWPANHKMVPVTLGVRFTNSRSAHSKIVAVTSSEPTDGVGDGDQSPDWEITGQLSLKLRAERSGRGPGRTYTVTVQATDTCGRTSTQSVTVVVPHDQPALKSLRPSSQMPPQT